jgi:hypothetical protein
MANKRIKDLATTATTTASDDFMAVDGTTNGTRKMNAAAPAFLTSVTTPSLTSPAATNLTLAGGTAGSDSVVVSNTLAASSSIIGAFKVGNGTAATNVAIGGGVLAVGGYASVGGSAGSFSALRILGSNTTGTTQAGVDQQVVFQSSATNAGRGVSSVLGTAAASFTMADGAAFYANSPSLGAASAITNNRGLHILNQGAAGITNAYGIDIAAQSGAATTNLGLRSAGIVSITNSTAGSASAGALVVTGGLSAGGASYFGGAVTIGSSSTLGQLALVKNGVGYASYIEPAQTAASTGNSFLFKNSGGSTLLTLAYDGAATFAGAVTAQSTVTVGSAASSPKIVGTGTVTVATSATQLSATDLNTGAMIIVSGYNNSGGSHGAFVLIVTGSGTVTTIASANATGLTPTFTVVSGKINMQLASGSMSVVTTLVGLPAL